MPGTDRSVRSASLQDREVSPLPYGEEQGAGTADPYRASGGAADPGSWNRYAYVVGDPVNFGDPSGLQVLPEPYLGVGIYCTNVWGAEGSSYECSPEFAYIMSYFGPATLAQETSGGGGGGLRYYGPQALEAMARGRFGTVFARALLALGKENCAGVFGTYTSRSGGGRSLSAVDVLLGFRVDTPGRSGVIKFKYMAPSAEQPVPDPAFTEPLSRVGFVANRISGGTPRAKITINTYGAGTYWNDNLYNATEILLHELGHAMRIIGFRGGEFVHKDREYQVGMANINLVRTHCLNP